MEIFENIIRHGGNAYITFVKAHDEEPNHFVVSSCGHGGRGETVEEAITDLVERVREASSKALTEAKALSEAVR